MDHYHGDHGDHGDHGEDSDISKSCPMIMVFHGGHCERILWPGWLATTVTEFVLSCLALFLLAFIYELLKFFREHLLRKEARKVAERMAIELRSKSNENSCNTVGCSNAQLAELEAKSYLQRIFGSSHLIQTVLNLVQIIISYLLMLIFMTFNYWLCLSVVLGLGLGYFFFGWVKKDPKESECCP